MRLCNSPWVSRFLYQVIIVAFLFISSDELASEALYSSWKPFMDGNENNKVKLVIGTPTSDATTSRANT